ncbi:hypothetical protein sos41_09420 [Alphaproteobacteria bacterium SO-S41]|nr:hypothetical protein sos41_09420 [Alphaproteobacteria bacterium SO-S41]
MLQGAIIGAVIGLLYAIFAYTKAKSAKGLEYLKAMPKRVASFEVAKSPDEVMAALAGGVPVAKADLAASDPATHRLLLAQPATFNNWGFFFPVYLTAAGNGTKVEVGAVSRSYMWGAAVTKIHQVFVGQLKTQLGAAA